MAKINNGKLAFYQSMFHDVTSERPELKAIVEFRFKFHYLDQHIC